MRWGKVNAWTTMTRNAHFVLSHKNTHKLCSDTSSPLRRHCDAIPLSHLSMQGIVGVMYVFWGQHPFWIFCQFLLQIGANGRRCIWYFLISSCIRCVWVSSLPYAWFSSSMVPLQPFTSAVSRGGLWMATPWIYTGDLTIIHPCSFQIGSLLKVNCTR